jgi:hypothetical protein
MQYVEKFKSWCVVPTHHTNYLDVVAWCHERFGFHAVDGEREGIWSYCNGDFYGLTYQHLGYEFPDYRICFSFKDEANAIMFAFAWA